MTNDNQYALTESEESIAFRRLKDRAVENSVLLKKVASQCEAMANENFALKNENTELQRLLEKVQRSFSWRITAPLRAAAALVRLAVRNKR